VLAQNRDINMLVMDTEVYSNTGGQASKATPTAAVAKFAAGGKEVKKKDLGAIAMSYGYIYVAQVAMGYDQAQTLKAIREAESYPGPAIVIAYCPCLEHGIKAGMSCTQEEMKKAVECGYWHLYRYDPRRIAEGKNPFQLDSPEPDSGKMMDYLKGENRYASLQINFPDRAQGDGAQVLFLALLAAGGELGHCRSGRRLGGLSASVAADQLPGPGPAPVREDRPGRQGPLRQVSQNG